MKVDMKKERVQEFAARVTQGSRTDLIVIMYDIILEDVAEARRIAESEAVSGKENNWKAYGIQTREEYKKELLHAARFVSELMAALDFRYRLSYELRNLYVYAHKCLTEAAFSGEVQKLSDVEDMMNGLKSAFETVAKEDTSGPVMQNSQKLTAGLTYGKGRLNEICVDPSDAKRGFLA